MPGYWKNTSEYHSYKKKYKKLSKICDKLSNKINDINIYLGRSNTSIDTIKATNKIGYNSNGEAIDKFINKMMTSELNIDNTNTEYVNICSSISSRYYTATSLRDKYQRKYEYESENPEWIEVDWW